MKPRRASLYAVLAFLWPAHDAYAREPRAPAALKGCLNAAESAQALMEQGKLIDARSRFLLCAQESCPQVVRSDCHRWLSEVEVALPTVVFRVQDGSGGDLSRVRVSSEEATLARGADGTANPVDPGPHTFVFESEGYEPARVSVVVRLGEHNRIISAQLRQLAKHGEPPPATQPPPDGRVPLAAWLVGGLGVLSAGAGVGLWVVGRSDYAALNDRCGGTHTCPADEGSAVRTKLVLGDIAVGVGVLAVAGAVIYALAARPARTVAASSLGPLSLAW